LLNEGKKARAGR